MKFTEAQLEQAVIDLIIEEGHAYEKGCDTSTKVELSYSFLSETSAIVRSFSMICSVRSVEVVKLLPFSQFFI